ncbi:MAG: hypothetical protein M3Q29_20905 [Chloroflexota bacterium]|nr:hypothetical protein [Chloroflexota bacterium]
MQSESGRVPQQMQHANDEDRFRTTVYLTEVDISALDEMKSYFRRREKRQVDRSQLIREAIRRYREELLAR